MKEEEKEDEKLEKTFMREFGYSYKYLATLYDTLDQAQKTLKYYVEHTVGSDEDRHELARLSVEADAVRLQVYELWCVSDKHLLEAKRLLYFKQKPGVDKKQVEEVRAKIRSVEDRLENIIRKTRQHVEKLVK